MGLVFETPNKGDSAPVVRLRVRFSLEGIRVPPTSLIWIFRRPLRSVIISVSPLPLFLGPNVRKAQKRSTPSCSTPLGSALCLPAHHFQEGLRRRGKNGAWLLWGMAPLPYLENHSVAPDAAGRTLSRAGLLAGFSSPAAYSGPPKFLPCSPETR